MDTIQSIFGVKPIKLFDELDSATNLIDKIGKIDATLAFELNAIPKKVLIRSLNTAIGIEVETEGLEPVSDNDFPNVIWGTVADGSLRNGGMEFVSHVGIRAHHAYAGLAGLFSFLRKSKAKVSDRTSIHVHLNVLNMTTEELNSLLILYAVVEDSLFQYAGDFRVNNVFCTPLSMNSKGLYSSIESYLKGSQKYTAFNTLSVREKGTVEFRHMQTSYDEGYVFRWVVMLCLLRYYSRYNSLEDIKLEISALRTKSEYNTFYQKIFYGFVKYLPIDPKKVDSLATDAKLYFFGED